MASKIIQLGRRNLDYFMNVEENAFMLSIRATRNKIKQRLRMGHEYIPLVLDNKVVGSLGMRYEKFEPNMEDFSQRFPTFDEYAELLNNKEANAGFIYSLGIIPNFRNFMGAKCLIQKAMNKARQKGMDYIVGDARIPSYNGSDNLPYEKFEFNPELREAVDNYHKTGKLPSRELLEKDPVAGFYLRAFPKTKVLGITNKDFWKGDKPCGGQMCIVYQELKEK